jgi:hypothetical protein
MKRISFFLLIFFLLTPMATGHAQNVATAIDSLIIDFWPDYDKASVLVLLTGTLPDDTKLPAAVTLPIPKTAQLNAVARIDGKDGQMIDDISWNTGPAGTLKFITPDLRFRVEYYFPYTVNNDQRSFDYTWIADLSVDKFQLKVQQPLSASFLNTAPGVENVKKVGNGFNYHTYPVQSIPGGQPFSMHVEYKMTTAKLSVESLSQQNNSLPTPGMSDKSTIGSGISWPIVAIAVGGLIMLIVLVWQIVSHRSLSGKRDARQSKGKFCRNCGEPIDEEDNFCRGCGKDL